jgi:hypothetical protein
LRRDKVEQGLGTGVQLVQSAVLVLRARSRREALALGVENGE